MARKSLRDLDNEALTDPTPTAAPDTAPPPAAEPAAAAPAARPRRAKGKTGAPGTSVIGVYLQRPTFNAARGAYIADIINLPDGPETFSRWIDAAVADYASLTTAERQHIAANLPPQERDGSQGINRSFTVSIETVDAAQDALRADMLTGWVRSRSELSVEAVQHAIEAAKARNGGVLPVAPARLPNKPMR